MWAEAVFGSGTLKWGLGKKGQRDANLSQQVHAERNDACCIIGYLRSTKKKYGFQSIEWWLKLENKIRGYCKFLEMLCTVPLDPCPPFILLSCPSPLCETQIHSNVALIWVIIQICLIPPPPLTPCPRRLWCDQPCDSWDPIISHYFVAQYILVSTSYLEPLGSQRRRSVYPVTSR